MFVLHIGNKNYSSWSMRPWVAMTAFGIPFEERPHWLDTPEFAAQLSPLSPVAKVPVLEDGDLTLWESNTIVRYLCAEYGTEQGWYLADPRQRALADKWMDWTTSSFAAPFRTLVWELIDSNTLVVALAHRAQPRDFLDCWWITSASPSALRLRQAGIAVPDHDRPRSATQPRRLTAGARARMEAELRVARRQADTLRQAVNDQHKTHWLDGMDNAASLASLLENLEAAESRYVQLRWQLCRPDVPAHHEWEGDTSDRRASFSSRLRRW